MEQLYKSFDSIAFYMRMGGETPTTDAEFQEIVEKWYKLARPDYTNPIKDFINKYGIEALKLEINEIF